MPRRLWHWREPRSGEGFGYAAGVYPFEKRYRALSRSIELDPWDSMPQPDVDANGLDLFPRYYVTTANFQPGDIVVYTPTADSSTYDDDQQARSFIETNSATDDLLGVAVRVTGTAVGSEDFYAAMLDGGSGYLRLVKVAAGATTDLDVAVKTFSASDEGWHVKVEAEGTTIRAKAWRWDAREPSAWDLEVVDATHASGVPGLASIINVSTAAPALGKARFLSCHDGTGDRDAPRPKTNAELAAFAAGRRGADAPMFLVHVGVLGFYYGGFFGTTPVAQASTLCLSTAPFTSSSVDNPPNTTYHDVITEMPVLRSEATEIFTGQSRQDYGSMTVHLGGGDRDHWITWNFDGRPWECWVGGIGWDRWDFIKVTKAVVGSIETPDPDHLVFNIRDKSAALARTFQDATVSGTDANAGRTAPYCLGYLFNIEPVLEDAAALQYRFDDGTHNDAVITLSDVREKGSTAAFTEETDADSGTFTLSGAPTGRLTADVHVSTADTHPAIFFEVADVAGLDAYKGDGVGSEANWTDAAQAGFFLPCGDEATTGQILDKVAESGSAFWWFDSDQHLRATQFDAPTTYHHHELTQDKVRDFRPERFILPSFQEPVYAKKNWTRQTEELAGVAAADQALYAAPGAAVYPDAILGLPPLSDARQHLLVRMPEFRETLYYAAADAETEAERRRLIFWVPTVIFTMEVRSWLPRFGMGETVELTHERFGFSAGKTGLIVGIEHDMTRGTIRLSLFAQITEQFPEVTSTYTAVPTSEVY